MIAFKIRPHERSPRYVTVKVFKSQASRRAALIEAEGFDCPLVSVKYEAGHVGRAKRCELGTIYLTYGPTFARVAVHELLHAAIYYVTEVRGRSFELSSQDASPMVCEAEEMVAETLENYFHDFTTQWARKLPYFNRQK